MPTIIHIISPNEIFHVNEANQISRPELTRKWGNVGLPSNGWKLTGAEEYRKVFGRWVVVKLYTVDDIRKGVVPWRWKNGKQRCFITDLDHGASRVWASPTPYYTTTVQE